MSTGLNVDWGDLDSYIGEYHFNCITGEVSIIGASDEMNEGLRSRSKTLSEEELREYLKDAVEFTNIKKTPVTSENYADYRKPTQPMPKHCYGTSYGQREQKKIEQRLKDYYLDHSMTKEELKKFFKDRCKDMRVVMAQERRTTGTDPEHNRQIILDAYETFRRANSVMANLACDKEGENWLAKMVGKRERIKIGYIIMRISIMSPKS